MASDDDKVTIEIRYNYIDYPDYENFKPEDAVKRAGHKVKIYRVVATAPHYRLRDAEFFVLMKSLAHKMIHFGAEDVSMSTGQHTTPLTKEEEAA